MQQNKTKWKDEIRHMKIARVSNGQGDIFHAVFADGKFRRIAGDIFGSHQLTDEVYARDSVRLLAPVEPVNVICIGLNYGLHAKESMMNAPKHPLIFIKTTNTVVGPEDNIVIPAAAPDEVDYEAELVIVIGKKAKNVSREDAFSYIFGYTCGNDVSARDCQLKQDSQWARGKSFDTFCPIGPWIETEMDAEHARITGRLNGAVMQDSNTDDMLFPVSEIVSFCSRHMTLLPGTIIMSGTPEGVGFARKTPVFMKPGDVFEVEIEGIGTLKNTCIAEDKA